MSADAVHKVQKHLTEYLQTKLGAIDLRPYTDAAPVNPQLIERMKKDIENSLHRWGGRPAPSDDAPEEDKAAWAADALQREASLPGVTITAKYPGKLGNSIAFDVAVDVPVSMERIQLKLNVDIE
jgi:hypothetical protein